MKMKKTILFLSIALLTSNLFSQEEKKEEFKAHGKPYVKVFTNFHSTIIDEDAHNEFEIQRAYMGYSYSLSEKFSGKAIIDVGNPEAGKLEMTAFLKYAYLQYKSDKFYTKFGLIGMSQFSSQEKLWGGRYLFKSFQDKYKFGPSADLGVYANYKIHKALSIDATISNGEGYKKLEADSALKYSTALTLKPIKGLKIRAYYDYMGNKDAQQSVALYAGYETKEFNLGAEYNQQINHGMTKDKDMKGLSFYGSYNIKKTRLFARFDQLSSVKIDNAPKTWNNKKDGQGIIAGIEFSPVKGFKITPNYQVWLPADGSSIINMAYLSCEIKF